MNALLPGIGQPAVDIESSNAPSKKAFNTVDDDQQSFRNTMDDQQRKVDKASKSGSAEKPSKAERVDSARVEKAPEDTQKPEESPEVAQESAETATKKESTNEEQATAQVGQPTDTAVSEASEGEAVETSFSFVSQELAVEAVAVNQEVAEEAVSSLTEESLQTPINAPLTNETVLADSVTETEHVNQLASAGEVVQGVAQFQGGLTSQSGNQKVVKTLSSAQAQITPDAKASQLNTPGALTQNMEDLRGRVLGPAIEATSKHESLDPEGAKAKFVLSPTAAIKPATSGITGLTGVGRGQTQTPVILPTEALVRGEGEAALTEKVSPTGFTAQTFTSLTGLTTPQVTTVDARMQMPVSIAFGEAGWAAMVAERSAMMASQRIKFAELQLDPPELGPMQVKVTVNDQQASVSFVAPNAQVKDALDQTIIRLREMLEQQGIDLVDVNVSDQAPEESEQGDTEEDTELAQDESNDSEASSVVETVSHYGVDHYA